MKQKSFYLLLLLATIFTWSCQKEADVFAPVISGAEVDTVLNIGDKLVLAPDITNLVGIEYTWLVNGKEVAAGQTDYTFTATDPGNFVVLFRAGNKGGTGEQAFKILVEEPIAIALENGLTIPLSQVLDIEPAISGPERDDYQYEWAIGDSIIGLTATLPFISVSPGDYTLTLTTTAGKQSASATCDVKVEDAEYKNNAYTVLEYCPAPARGFNWSIIGSAAFWDMTEFPLPYEDFLTKSTEMKSQRIGNEMVVGSWGGYITFKFDHTVANVPGQPDLELNATFSNVDHPTVYVAYDSNKNGKPDEDEWFEIKGDDYGLEDIPDYEITFTYAGTDIESDPLRFYTSFTWKDNQETPRQDEVVYNNRWNNALTMFGTISTKGFFPGYHIKDQTSKEIVLMDGWESSFSRKGKRISKDLTGKGTVLQKLNIDIANAVNDNGEPVHLPGVDFVKILKSSYPYVRGVDENMTEGRMLLVRDIIDKHLLD